MDSGTGTGLPAGCIPTPTPRKRGDCGSSPGRAASEPAEGRAAASARAAPWDLSGGGEGVEREWLSGKLGVRWGGCDWTGRARHDEDVMRPSDGFRGRIGRGKRCAPVSAGARVRRGGRRERPLASWRRLLGGPRREAAGGWWWQPGMGNGGWKRWCGGCASQGVGPPREDSAAPSRRRGSGGTRGGAPRGRGGGLPRLCGALMAHAPRRHRPVLNRGKGAAGEVAEHLIGGEIVPAGEGQRRRV